MKKQSYILTAIVVCTLWAGYKVFVWYPYYSCFQFPSIKSTLKAGLTVFLTKPFDQEDSYVNFHIINSQCYWVDAASNPELLSLVHEFPLPPNVVDERLSKSQRLENLALFVSQLSPLEKQVSRTFEPVRALVLLGQKASSDGIKAPVQKLCSASAKIFVQYADYLGFIARIEQLQGHIIAAVYNADTKLWESYDPFMGCAVKNEGKNISSTVAFDLIKSGKKIEYCGSPNVFKTVVIVPRSNFSHGALPRWHYFLYDNLSYWKVRRVSELSPLVWQQRVTTAQTR